MPSKTWQVTITLAVVSDQDPARGDCVTLIPEPIEKGKWVHQDGATVAVLDIDSVKLAPVQTQDKVT